MARCLCCCFEQLHGISNGYCVNTAEGGVHTIQDQSQFEYAVPLFPNGLWQPDIEQSVGTVPLFALWDSDFFSILPR